LLKNEKIAFAIEKERITRRKYDGFNDTEAINLSRVKEGVAHKIPGVVHVGNSARIQTVTEAGNGRYYQLIKAFQSITGVPILINTSFNKKGIPIIETPRRHLHTFLSARLIARYLVIISFIKTKHQYHT
jgi:predicted NodU family carbamoyl transferase